MRRRQSTDVALLAGWLFADLLLALAVVVLGSAQGMPSAAVATTTTTASTTPTTTFAAGLSGQAVGAAASSVTTAPPPAGVERTPVKFEVASDFGVLTGADGPAKAAEQDRVVNEVRTKLAELNRSSDKAALVLTFGVHPTTGSGERLADQFNQTIAAGLPDVFGEAALRSFDYRTNEGTGTLKVEVYFLNK